jgi:hypothetical protein
MFAYLLPASLLQFVADTVRTRVERWAGIADRQMSQMEAELDARQLSTGISPPATPAIEAESSSRRRKAA